MPGPTIAVAPIVGTNASGNASVTLNSCVKDGTVVLAIGTDFDTVTFGDPTCTGETPHLRGTKSLTNWGGTNASWQFADCVIQTAGNKTFTAAGFGVGEDSQIFGMQFNETLTFDKDGEYISLSGAANQSTSIVTDTDHEAIIALISNTGGDATAGAGGFVHFNADDGYMTSDGEYLLDGGTAGTVSVPFVHVAASKVLIKSGAWRLSGPTISGVTKNNAGAIVGSCDVFLFQYNSGTTTLTQVGYMVSDPTTGAYSFTPPDSTATYMTAAFKAGSPNVFDVTDHNLQQI